MVLEVQPSKEARPQAGLTVDALSQVHLARAASAHGVGWQAPSGYHDPEEACAFPLA
jgi:hypothetical protein